MSTDLGVIIATNYQTATLTVLSLLTGAQLRIVGKAGAGVTVGAQAEMGAPGWLCTCPWSSTTVLVPDYSNHRVTEIDFVTGFLVKVWFTGVTKALGVAATKTRIVVVSGWDSATTSLKMYDLSGNQLWTVSGASLALGDTSGVGTRLGAPAGVKFSQDGSYVVVAEWYSERVTKWNAATGAHMSTVATTYRATDVVECDTGSGTGTVIADYNSNRLARISETGVATTLLGLSSPTGVVLVPGWGVLVSNQALHQVQVYTSVAILTHPVGATATVPQAVTFTLALTAASASTGLTYVWTKGGVAVGGNSATYTYTPTDADVDAGPSYPVQCTVTHALGTATSNTVTLVVVRGVTVTPATANAVVGGAGVTFTATPASGNTVSLYAWTLGGVPVGTNAATYTYTAVDGQGGLTLAVMCTVTATKGVAGSAAQMLVQVGDTGCSCSLCKAATRIHTSSPPSE